MAIMPAGVALLAQRADLPAQRTHHLPSGIIDAVPTIAAGMPQLMIVAALRRNQVLVQGRHKRQPLTRQHKRSTDRDKTRLHTGMPRLRPCQTHLPTQGGAASALAPVAPYLIQHGVAVIASPEPAIIFRRTAGNRSAASGP